MIFRYDQFGSYSHFGVPSAASATVRPQVNFNTASSTLAAALAGKLKLDSAGVLALRDSAEFFQGAYTAEQKARGDAERDRDSARSAVSDRTRERDNAIGERDSARGLAVKREQERDAAANLAYTRERERDAARGERDGAFSLAYTREKERDAARGERDNAANLARQREQERDDAYKGISQRDGVIGAVTKERDDAIGVIRQKDNTIGAIAKERDDAVGAVKQRDGIIGAVTKERDDARGIVKQRDDALAQRTTELNRAMDRIKATDTALAQAAKVADLVPGLQSQLEKIGAALEAATKDRDAAINLANTRGTELGKAVDEVNNRGRTIDDLAVRLKDSGAALDAAAARAALVPGLEAKLKQMDDYMRGLQQERDNAIAETGRVRAEAGKEIDNQRAIGQRMVDEANKSAAERLGAVQLRITDLERGKALVEGLSKDLEAKIGLLTQQYDDRLAAEAAQAKSALEAAQADLQKARDACAADLGAAQAAKQQVDAMLIAAQDEATKCAAKIAAPVPAPKAGMSPLIALAGGLVVGLAASKVMK